MNQTTGRIPRLRRTLSRRKIKKRFVSASLDGPARPIFPMGLARPNAASGLGILPEKRKFPSPEAIRAEATLEILGFRGRENPAGIPSEGPGGAHHRNPLDFLRGGPRRGKEIFSLTMIFLLSIATRPLQLCASEVIEETKTHVIIREHPKTGKPYVSIVSSEIPGPPDPFTGQRGRIIRPDYRLLDPKVKSGEIPYEGPVSDHTRIYILAATLATLGAAGAVLAPAAAPAAAGAAASGGAGAYLAGGAAVTAGSAAAYSVAAHVPPEEENYQHESKYQLTKED